MSILEAVRNAAANGVYVAAHENTQYSPRQSTAGMQRCCVCDKFFNQPAPTTQFAVKSANKEDTEMQRLCVCVALGRKSSVQPGVHYEQRRSC